MEAKLYVMGVSHPAQGARMMMQRKGIEPKLVKLDLIAGLHDIPLKIAGFDDRTVPALKIDGRKVQGSMQIARALDEIQPDPPLLPSDPEQRRKVTEAEAWGHDVFQQVPREIAVAALGVSNTARANFARTMGFPGFVAPGFLPIAKRMGKNASTNVDVARATLEALPGHLDRVDAYLADGVLDSADGPTAADCQIVPTVRLMLAIEDLAPYVEGRPAADYARRLLPDYFGPIPAGTIPAEWLSRPAAAV